MRLSRKRDNIVALSLHSGDTCAIARQHTPSRGWSVAVPWSALARGPATTRGCAALTPSGTGAREQRVGQNGETRMNAVGATKRIAQASPRFEARMAGVIAFITTTSGF